MDNLSALEKVTLSEVQMARHMAISVLCVRKNCEYFSKNESLIMGLKI
jgi:hypothetical protein